MGRAYPIELTNMCMLQREDGCVLVQNRHDPEWGGLTFPGGHVEPGESLVDSVIREMREETGLIAHRLELFGVFSGKELHYIYPNGDEVSNVDIVFLCKDYSGTLRPDEKESEQLQFFEAGKLPEKLSPPIAIPLRCWEKKKLGLE